MLRIFCSDLTPRDFGNQTATKPPLHSEMFESSSVHDLAITDTKQADMAREGQWHADSIPTTPTDSVIVSPLRN